MQRDYRSLLSSAAPGITGAAARTTPCATATATPLTERLSIRQRDGDEDSARGAVKETVRGDLNSVASFDAGSCPARRDQVIRGQHLKVPELCLAGAVHDFQFDPGMGIGPSELLDDTFHGNGLGAIDTDGSVVRIGRSDKPQSQYCRAESFRYFHRSILLSTCGC